MFQQTLALIVIVFFLARLFWQKQKKQIAIAEFIFWLFFWLISAGAIISLKWLDKIVANLGFSASGINILLYLSVTVLFYLIFRLRLKLSKIERDITKLVRHIALKK
ncbi:DUF2304 family protein [Patescibacteria group bacterium]|nr:DUF2304 family protein [Patescibacteria group bacterium]MBU0879749.1 DUF2304 family protein [Patescibacteria group bacterium]MBU0879974.1 DUF2304 family protein [Patescibacteria group bacterium]MBU0897516.1 DUF2304 family protein [Patescibacteria group bacterium]MBU1063027.1 DUF2304 family protein [Patescibacteria group bacterium]